MKKGTPGRPPVNGEAMKQYIVTLDKATLEALQKISSNRSQAVREAVKIASRATNG